MDGLNVHMAETLERKIRLLPVECMAEIEMYIDFLLYRHNSACKEEKENVSDFFGSVQVFGDGLEYQWRIRNEWAGGCL